MNAEIATAKQAFLASGGKVTKLAGFTGIKPLPERREPALDAENIGGQVCRKYMASMLGTTVNACFSATAAHRKLLPKPVGRSSTGGFMYDKAAADAAVATIRAAWAERDSCTRVGRDYFVEALGVSVYTLFNAVSIWSRYMPPKLPSEHLGTGSKCWYDKKEADKAIRKIKKIKKDRAAAQQ